MCCFVMFATAVCILFLTITNSAVVEWALQASEQTAMTYIMQKILSEDLRLGLNLNTCL